MKARRSCSDAIQTKGEHTHQLRQLHPAKLSITMERENKIFHGKTKFTSFYKTSPTKDNKWETPTQGGKLNPRKTKKAIIFQQTQKKTDTQI
jgi:hypothetical protein